MGYGGGEDGFLIFGAFILGERFLKKRDALPKMT